MKIIIISMLLLFGYSVQCKEYHVAKSGNDLNIGSKENPFKTISAAAKIAEAGDKVIVHNGIYRERVDPLNGGTSDLNRIVYEAASGERVVIKGSETIKNWKREENGIWTVIIDNKFFKDYNPYRELLKGDWLQTGLDLHTGEVYLNGKSLYEVNSKEKIGNTKPLPLALDKEGSTYKWYCEVNEENTKIWANFHDSNPNKELVEINVRPTVFFPRRTHVNYITVRGFVLSQAATQWAPPTAEQIGLIGPHWSKGWIIENNIITDSKCSGISLGKERSTGQNEWSKFKFKHGTQREREAIFRALALDWNKENIGSHIVRNNEIYNCGQTGICGHLGAVFSTISHNLIHHIHSKRQFKGAEIAGIKLHAGIDVLIENNCIYKSFKGLWIDWQAQGMRVTKNLAFDNAEVDLEFEVCHGPHIVDNNIFLSKVSLWNFAQGGAYLHNIFGGLIQVRQVLDRFTPYHVPHSTTVLGLMTIQSGDERFYNNIFYKKGENVNPKFKTNMVYGYGLDCYNEHPIPSDDWMKTDKLADYHALKFPMLIDGNAYLGGAKSFSKEKNTMVDESESFEIAVIEKTDGFYLTFRCPDAINNIDTKLLSTETLGRTLQTESIYDCFDGRFLRFDSDYFNQKRGSKPKVGPFEKVEKSNTFKVWSKL